MDYKIRLAKKTDVKNLSLLRQEVWDETFRGIYNDDIIDNYDYEEAEKFFLNTINNEKISFYVVESKDELVGYMDVGYPTREFEGYE